MTFLKKAGMVSAFCTLINLSAAAADYYVAVNGDDTLNTGGVSDPFKTISKAVAVMGDGDTCYVNGGTYRETVNFDGKSGLTVKAVDGEQVVLSGLDKVTGSWTNESGNIWYAAVNGMLTRSIPINEGKGDKEHLCDTFESQVYKDDTVQFLARWPNKQSTDYDKLMDKDWHSMTSDECKASVPESFYTEGFSADWTTENLSGAYFWAKVQNEWCSWMAPVTGYNPSTKKMILRSFYTNENDLHFWISTKHNPKIKDRGSYFGRIIVLGAKILLDDENEFFTDFENNRIYVYSTTDPSSKNYEVKTRHTAFILPETASNIIIEGIDVRAATMTIEGQNCVIKGSTLDFPSYGYAPYMNNMTTQIPGLTNLKLKGSKNVLRDSTIENCFGGAFEVQGSDNYIHNCLARNVNTMASWHSGFIVSGIRNTVSHSTVYKVGRSGFSITDGRNCRVLYNDVSDVGYLTDDLGGLHSSRDTQNTEIAYNWFHDIQHGNAIYMDNYNNHYIIHHNVIWNTYGLGINHNRPSNHSFIINNTVLENWDGGSKSGWTGCIGQVFGPWSDGDEGAKQADSTYGSMWFNNLARNGVKTKGNRPYYGFYAQNNSSLSSNKLNSQPFDPTVHKISEGEDKGIYIKGITSEHVKDGKPDMGAYEVTNSAPNAVWTAGHDFENPPALPAFKEAALVYRNLINNGTFYYSKKNTAPEEWTYSDNAGDSVLVKYYEGYNDPPAHKRNAVFRNALTVVSSTAEDTFVERSVTNLESNKHYNFAAFVRLFPHGDAASGVDDVTLYVKDSNGVELGSTTVKTFPNYLLNNRSTQQEWFLTEVAFELPEGETEITIGFSTDYIGTFFVDNVALQRKFSLAPVVDSSAIPSRAAINVATAFTVKVTDADSNIATYKWTIDGISYEGASVNHTFTQTSPNADISFVAVDEFGVESMPISRTVEVLTEIPPELTVSEAVLDTRDINAAPVVIQPSFHVDVDYSGAEYDTLALYIGESDPVALNTPVFTKSSITDFSVEHKLFIPSDSVKDGVEYHYVVTLSGAGKDTVQTSGTFTLDRMNMIPFTDKRALTHLSSSDRRLNAGNISRWENLLNRENDYDAVAASNAAVVKDDSSYSIKGMKSILFNNSGMKINTPVDLGVTAFIAARRQQAEVDLGGDNHQRIVSVLGSTQDYGQSGAWLEIRRVSNKNGTSIVFGPEIIAKKDATLKQGPIFLGRYAKSDSYRYIGEMFEVVVFNNVLSDAEAAIVSQWLTDKWTGASFPQAGLDWDGDGLTNANEIAGGTDPSFAEPMRTEWLAPIQNKKKQKLWWSIRVEQAVKHYLIQINGQDIIVPASKPNGGMYELDLPVKQIVTNFYAVGYDDTSVRVGVWQQDSGAATPVDPLGTIDENLPSILVIGDSISIGYDPTVRNAMKGAANIIHNPGNGADTRYGVAKIDEWLYREWDVIHFNWGLHDLKRLDGANVGVTISDYKTNLQHIINRMRTFNPNAKLIFATTTPYPDGVSPIRHQADAKAYNDAAKEVMTANNIDVNDLHALMMTKLDTNNDGIVTNAEDNNNLNLQVDTNVHFKGAGSKVLADEVVVYLNNALGDQLSPPQVETSAASAVGDTDAVLNGRLENYGNSKTDVLVYWGTTDGAGVKGDWENSLLLADDVEANSDYNHSLTGLEKGKTYYFRFYAENASGFNWGNTVLFKTGIQEVTLGIDTDLHISQTPGLPVAGYSQLIAGDRHTNGDCRIFMKFDMSSLPGNIEISKATLRLYHVTGLDDNNEDAYVHNIKTDWTLDTITYNHDISTERTFVVGADSYNQYVEVDVTSLMQLGDHYGFSIRGPEIITNPDTNTKTGSYFQSSEGTNKPQLVLKYQVKTTPAQGVSVKQTGRLVQWTVEEEFNVKEYRLVDRNGRVIEVVTAEGLDSYSVTLDQLIKVSLIVVDKDGSTQKFSAEDGNIVTADYKLRKGWNLIAIPGNNADLKELKRATAGIFWTWDGQKYIRTNARKAYEGVWVYAAQPVSVNVSAVKADSTITLNPGWNLAGPANNVAVPDNVDAVFSYNQKYESILNNYALLCKGTGYWFFVKEKTKIKVDVSK